MNLEESLAIELESVTGLSGKVYPVEAEQDTKVPYVVYALIGSSRDKELGGYNGLMEARYLLEIYHSTYASLNALMNLIITEVKTFERSTLATTGTYVQQVDITDESREYDAAIKLYYGVIALSIFYEE